MNDSFNKTRHNPGAYLQEPLPQRRMQVKIIYITSKLLIAIHQVFIATVVGTAALLLLGFLVSDGDAGCFLVVVLVHRENSNTVVCMCERGHSR